MVARAAMRSSVKPERTSAGVRRPRLLCRCSALYQEEKTWQEARSSWIEPKRSGNPGRYFSSLGLRLRERVVAGDVRAALGLGDAQVGQEQRHRFRGHGRSPGGVDGQLITGNP